MAAVPAAAQSITGAIVGRVTDPSDAVIVGASVRAINAATGALDAATTDDTGFCFEGVHRPAAPFLRSSFRFKFRIRR